MILKEMLPLPMVGKNPYLITSIRMEMESYKEQLNGLKMWVDDGDAKTEAGELMGLAIDYGIFGIEIPVDGKWSSTVQTLGMNSVTELGFMAVLTRSPTSGEMSNYVDQLTTGGSIKAFIEELLNTSGFTNEIMSQGVNDVVYDMIKTFSTNVRVQKK